MAFLLAVALVALLTSGGIDLPNRAPVTPAADPCRTPLPARAVGIAPGSWWKSDPRAVDDMRQMADMGVRWLRVGLEWSAIEPAQGEFDWSSVDKVMQQAKSDCLAVLAMVGTTPKWARRPGCPNLWCPPQEPKDFGRFVTEVAARYSKSTIRAWEVWNEPNHASWFRPVPNPERYGRLLVVAAKAIRKEDAGATILSGGVAPSPKGDPRKPTPDEFLEKVYDSGAMDVVDGVAYHPYSFPELPSERTGNNGFIDQLEAVRHVMVEHGDSDEQIWLTEFGYPTPRGQSEYHRQEEMMTDGFGLWRSLDYVGPLFWFAWRDPPASASSAQRDFGLRQNDDEPKPAFGVFEQELRR